ncbi:mCG1029975, partial [Mus musculus]
AGGAGLNPLEGVSRRTASREAEHQQDYYSDWDHYSSFSIFNKVAQSLSGNGCWKLAESLGLSAAPTAQNMLCIGLASPSILNGHKSERFKRQENASHSLNCGPGSGERVTSIILYCSHNDFQQIGVEGMFKSYHNIGPNV